MDDSQAVQWMAPGTPRTLPAGLFSAAPQLTPEQQRTAERFIAEQTRQALSDGCCGREVHIVIGG